VRLLEKIGGLEKRFAKARKVTCEDLSPYFKTTKISNFTLGKKLGNGRFGNVYLAEEKYTKTLYALKMMNKNKIK
jgi:serine/threonine protein kinase